MQLCAPVDHVVCEECIWDAIPDDADWPAVPPGTYTLTLRCEAGGHVLDARACAALISKTEEDYGY